MLSNKRKRELKVDRRQIAIDSIEIGIPSPNQILTWGERLLPNGKKVGLIKNSKTVNYKRFTPFRDGLFCERIFGPVTSFVCACGKKQPHSKVTFCEKCEVEYIDQRSRRYRLGYISLLSPVTHIWYLKGRPSYLSLFLGKRKKTVIALAYCNAYLIEHAISKKNDATKNEQIWPFIQSPSKKQTFFKERFSLRNKEVSEFCPSKRYRELTNSSSLSRAKQNFDVPLPIRGITCKPKFCRTNLICRPHMLCRTRNSHSCALLCRARTYNPRRGRQSSYALRYPPSCALLSFAPKGDSITNRRFVQHERAKQSTARKEAKQSKGIQSTICKERNQRSFALSNKKVFSSSNSSVEIKTTLEASKKISSDNLASHFSKRGKYKFYGASSYASFFYARQHTLPFLPTLVSHFYLRDALLNFVYSLTSYEDLPLFEYCHNKRWEPLRDVHRFMAHRTVDTFKNCFPKAIARSRNCFYPKYKPVKLAREQNNRVFFTSYKSNSSKLKGLYFFSRFGVQLPFYRRLLKQRSSFCLSRSMKNTQLRFLSSPELSLRSMEKRAKPSFCVAHKAKCMQNFITRGALCRAGDGRSEALARFCRAKPTSSCALRARTCFRYAKVRSFASYKPLYKSTICTGIKSLICKGAKKVKSFASYNPFMLYKSSICNAIPRAVRHERRRAGKKMRKKGVKLLQSKTSTFLSSFLKDGQAAAGAFTEQHVRDQSRFFEKRGYVKAQEITPFKVLRAYKIGKENLFLDQFTQINQPLSDLKKKSFFAKRQDRKIMRRSSMQNFGTYAKDKNIKEKVAKLLQRKETILSSSYQFSSSISRYSSIKRYKRISSFRFLPSFPIHALHVTLSDKLRAPARKTFDTTTTLFGLTSQSFESLRNCIIFAKGFTSLSSSPANRSLNVFKNDRTRKEGERQTRSFYLSSDLISVGENRQCMRSTGTDFILRKLSLYTMRLYPSYSIYRRKAKEGVHTMYHKVGNCQTKNFFFYRGPRSRYNFLRHFSCKSQIFTLLKKGKITSLCTASFIDAKGAGATNLSLVYARYKSISAIHTVHVISLYKSFYAYYKSSYAFRAGNRRATRIPYNSLLFSALSKKSHFAATPKRQRCRNLFFAFTCALPIYKRSSSSNPAISFKEIDKNAALHNFFIKSNEDTRKTFNLQNRDRKLLRQKESFCRGFTNRDIFFIRPRERRTKRLYFANKSQYSTGTISSDALYRTNYRFVTRRCKKANALLAYKSAICQADAPKGQRKLEASLLPKLYTKEKKTVVEKRDTFKNSSTTLNSTQTAFTAGKDQGFASKNFEANRIRNVSSYGLSFSDNEPKPTLLEEGNRSLLSGLELTAIREILSYTGGGALQQLLQQFNSHDLCKFLFAESQILRTIYETRLARTASTESTKNYSSNLNESFWKDGLRNRKKALQSFWQNYKAERSQKNSYDDFQSRKSDLQKKQILRISRRIYKISRRLKISQLLTRNHRKPEWMILSHLPVLPPELRPILQMSEKVIVASDLNIMYQRVIYRNNRHLRVRFIDFHLVTAIQRLVQDAVDRLIENGKGGLKPYYTQGGRPLKSLSDILKGKKGRFRLNLLGKRVDFSGRSVIVVSPLYQIHECGLPKDIALELYHYFLLRQLIVKKYCASIVTAKKMIKSRSSSMWDVLRELMYHHPVLLNRAPTLHRLGIQAFQPKLVLGNAILLHPLVCSGFNADFDGDQMGVHLPLSFAARAESWDLLWSRNNLLSPATGQPMLVPSQDMVLGFYYITASPSAMTISSNASALRTHYKSSYALRYARTNLRSVKGQSTAEVDLYNTALPFSKSASPPYNIRGAVRKGFPSPFYEEKIKVKRFLSLKEISTTFYLGLIKLHTPVWLYWKGVVESEEGSKKPLELRIDTSGLQQKVYERLISSNFFLSKDKQIGGVSTANSNDYGPVKEKKRRITFLRENRQICTSPEVHYVRTTAGRTLMNNLFKE